MSTKPNESDYTSPVAYTRALEEYCAGIEAELGKLTDELLALSQDDGKIEGALDRATATLAKLKQQEPECTVLVSPSRIRV